MDETEEMGSPAPKRKALVAGDENGRQVDLAHHLEEEEKRTNQMKTLIQKVASTYWHSLYSLRPKLSTKSCFMK